MNLLVNCGKALKIYSDIWNKMKSLIKNSSKVNNDKYIKNKIKIYNDKVYTNFHYRNKM